MRKETNYYSIHFLNGDYLTISNDLMDRFESEFSGSGVSLYDGTFDVNFKCTPNQINKIISYVKENFHDVEIQKHDIQSHK